MTPNGLRYVTRTDSVKNILNLFKKSWENLEIAELVAETSLTWKTFAVSIRIHSSGKHTSHKRSI